MNKYKQAIRQKLRFNTEKGSVSVEQLWDLSLGELDKLAVRYEEESSTTSNKSFLRDKSPEDKEAKLRFEITLDVLETKAQEQERARQAQETKKQRQKILGLIEDKKDEELKGKSIEELEALLD